MEKGRAARATRPARPMTYRSRIDLGVAVVVIAIGALFALEGWRIDPSSYEAIGPRAVPMVLASVMIAFGAVIGLRALMDRDSDLPTPEGFGFRDSDIGRVLAVVGSGAVYVFTFWAAGYFGATIVAAVLAFLTFGVRSPVAIVLGAIAAGIVYQFIFMGLMGLLDPRGELLDLRFLSRIITPGS